MTSPRLPLRALTDQRSSAPMISGFSLTLVGTLLMLLTNPIFPLRAQGKPAPASPDIKGESCPLPPKGEAQLRNFKLVNDLFLEVDGKRVPADLYRSDTAGAMLVVSPSLPSPVVLRALALMGVERSSLEMNSGVVDVAPDATLSSLGVFEVTDDSVRFTIEGRRAVLLPRPPLLGLRQAEQVRSHNPEYIESARKYEPDRGVLAALRKERRAVLVKIFYGSWCPHCAMLVPNALRVQEDLGPSKIRFEYFGVPRAYGKDPEVKKNSVKAIPTAVVYVDGREVGRIVEDRSWNSLESSLRTLLGGASSLGAER